MSWTISFYKTSRGEKPVEEFIKVQQLRARAKIGHLIELLKTYGHTLSVPHAKRLRSELYELRIRGKVELRILYTFQKQTVILLHGFRKQTQKTPQKEIDIALKRIQSLT
jgi:phage-related protein